MAAGTTPAVQASAYDCNVILDTTTATTSGIDSDSTGIGGVGVGGSRLLLGAIDAIAPEALEALRVTHVLTILRGFEPPRTAEELQEDGARSGGDSGGAAAAAAAAAEFESPRPARVRTWEVIPLNDVATEDLLSELPRAVELLRGWLQPEGGDDGAAAARSEKGDGGEGTEEESTRVVLVHCAAGQSRSASVVLAYFMAVRGATFFEAVEQVQGRRPCISPNAGFTQQLKLFERLGCTVDHSHPDVAAHRAKAGLAAADDSWSRSDGCLSRSLLAPRQWGKRPTPGAPEARGAMCGSCGIQLFRRPHDIVHECARGNAVFLRPMRWMHFGDDDTANDDDDTGCTEGLSSQAMERLLPGNLSDLSGRIRCPAPRCQAKLGFYIWKSGDAAKHGCSACRAATFPAFSLNKNCLR